MYHYFYNNLMMIYVYDASEETGKPKIKTTHNSS